MGRRYLLFNRNICCVAEKYQIAALAGCNLTTRLGFIGEPESDGDQGVNYRKPPERSY